MSKLEMLPPSVQSHDRLATLNNIQILAKAAKTGSPAPMSAFPS